MACVEDSLAPCLFPLSSLCTHQPLPRPAPHVNPHTQTARAQGPNGISALVSGDIKYGPGFGCAIAGTIIQAIALGLEFAPRAAAAPPVLKSSAQAETA